MDKQDGTFKYFAFISYSSEDEKWAKWLHSHLENYHIPSRLCRENPGLPKKIRPVFWYKVDLSGSKLKSSLDKELESSNYLVVICSPHSAKSDWVNDEIVSFINKHGDERIIPVIVDGEPKSGNPHTECFPPAIRNLDREEQIRGINIPQMGKSHALVDVVATMFNVRFDSLWQRHRRRQIRNRIFCALLAIAMLIAGTFAFHYFRTSRQYFANYEMCFGMPVGINPLKKSELKSSLSHYVFETTRGKLRRVYLSNMFGHPINENSSINQFRAAILDLGYEDSKLNSITYSDAYGNPLYKLVYSDDYRRADIKDSESGDAASMFKSTSSTIENMGGAELFNISNVFMNSKSQVARYVYDYDAEGYISKIHFKRHNGSNETGFDDNGICGIEYERDSLHRVIEKRYFDENGAFMADKMGCAGAEYGYNDRGDVIYERFFNLEGGNQLSDMGYAISRRELDYPAQTATEYFFGLDEKPIMTLANYHKAVLKMRGDTLVYSYYDIDQQPTYMNFPQKGVGLVHKSKELYDNKGNAIEISYFGTDGNPCYDINRVHRITARYDEKGRFTGTVYYNAEGERQINASGVSETRISYDDDSNNPKTIEYFRRPGVRANISNLSRQVFTYSGNRIVKSACYDSNDMPSFPAANFGAPIVLLDYDDFGNVSDVWLKDQTGTSQYLPDTFASHVKATYDNGNCVKIEAFNKHGRPTMLLEGYAAIEMEYDKRGHRTATEYFDTIGLPLVIPALQYSRIESVFDPQGHEIETRTYGPDHMPVVCADGWAVKKQEFKDNLVTRISVFDADGKPTVANNIGSHTKEITYDANRRMISEKYFGRNHEPVLTDFGICEVRYTYNTHGMLLEVSTYNTAGQPVNSTRNFHKCVNEYDSRSNHVSEKYFDTFGHLVENTALGYAMAQSEYSPSGQRLSIKVYGADSLPTNNLQGVHEMLNKYTSEGDQILWAFLDKDGEPVSTFYGNDLFAICCNIYDDNGKFLGYAKFGSDYIESGTGILLIENGKERGYLWRDGSLTTRLRSLDGTERELSMLSSSPADHTYIKLLDSISESSRKEAQRIIEELVRTKPRK